MRLDKALASAMHPDLYQAMMRYQETGELDWTPPPGTPPVVPEVGPACTVCRDSGWLSVWGEDLAPKVVECRACELVRHRRRERCRHDNGVPEKFQTVSLSAIQPRTPEQRQGLEVVTGWVQRWIRAPRRVLVGCRTVVGRSR